MGMAIDAFVTVADLRAQLCESERRLLGEIWQYRRDRYEWVPTRVLHHRLGKDGVVTALNKLGGSIVRVVRDGGRDRYQLLFLGVLLTDDGQAAERLWAQYLAYLRDRFRRDPEMTSVVAGS